MFSYINIFNDFKEIAKKHKQIKSFGFGDIWEIASSGTINYPLLFIVPDGAIMGRGEVGNKFKVILMDRVLKDEQNETEVLSDTQQMLLDVLAELKNNKRDFHLRHDKISLEDFTERFDAEVTGWAADIILWVNYEASRCDIPTATLQTGTPISEINTFLSFIFPLNTTVDQSYIITDDEDGLYSVEKLTNISTIIYRVNGNIKNIPFTINVNDVLRIVISRADTSKESRVQLKGSG